jgi:hypothetical protein
VSRQKSDLTVNNIPVNFGGDAFYPAIDAKGIRIVGNRATANVQNAFVFYDRAEGHRRYRSEWPGAVFRRVAQVISVLHAGIALQRPAVRPVRECRSCRSRFRSQGSGTNEISIDGLDI